MRISITFNEKDVANAGLYGDTKRCLFGTALRRRGYVGVAVGGHCLDVGRKSNGSGGTTLYPEDSATFENVHFFYDNLKHVRPQVIGQTFVFTDTRPAHSVCEITEPVGITNTLNHFRQAFAPSGA